MQVFSSSNSQCFSKYVLEKYYDANANASRPLWCWRLRAEGILTQVHTNGTRIYMSLAPSLSFFVFYLPFFPVCVISLWLDSNTSPPPDTWSQGGGLYLALPGSDASPFSAARDRVPAAHGPVLVSGHLPLRVVLCAEPFSSPPPWGCHRLGHCPQCGNFRGLCRPKLSI